MVTQVHLTWPPPPTISVRRLFALTPFGGVVLSGGGTRTDFQVGALRYIVERGFDLWVVCGASGGSPNAAKLAEGEGTGSLERYWRGLTSYQDIYGPADWLSSLSSDPLVQTLASYLFLHHSESLIGFVGGGIVSAFFGLLGGELPNVVSYAQGLETIVKIGLDIGKIASDIMEIINSSEKSILITDPFRIKLNGYESDWYQIGYGEPGVVSAVSLSVVLGLDGLLEAFIVDSNTSVRRAHQFDLGALAWTDWSLVTDGATSPSITVGAVGDGAGKIQVFRVGEDDHIYQAAESAPTAGAPLGGWTPLIVGHAAFKSSLVPILDGTNRVRLLAIGTDSAIYQISETAAVSATYGSWTQIGGSTDLAISIRAGLNLDGRLEVFCVRADNQVYHAVENAPGGMFSAWEQLGQTSDTALPAIDVVLDSAGFLQVCRSSSDGNVYVARQLLQSVYFSYSSWIALPRPPQGAGLIKYGVDANGTLQLFLIGADRTLYHSSQEVAEGTWSSWFPVTPGWLSLVYSEGFTGRIAFPTQEVYDIVTGRHGNGQLEAFVRGDQLAPLHVSQRVPLLDSQKVQASGIKLRMSVVSLESARLRYADENAQFVDNPAEGQFSLGDAVVASGSVPSVFPPVKLINDNYVDGGIRDLLPIKAAIDAGANSVISVVGSQPMLLPAASFDGANLFDIAARGIADIMPNQILQDHLNPPVPWPVPMRAVQVTDLPYNHTVHGEIGIEPGLVAISIDYGYMRAYDDLDPTPTALNDNPGPALHDNTNQIIDLRLIIWRIEHAINGQRLPLQDISDAILNRLNGTPINNPVTDSTQLPQLRIMKWQLKALVDERRLALGGRVPSRVESWWLNWEEHSWLPVVATPWLEFTGVTGPNVGRAPWRDGPPRPLGDDDTLIAEQSASVTAYIIFGGAKFLVSLPWKTFNWTDVHRVPDGALVFDKTLAADGTVVSEDGSDSIFVIWGGAKFTIPSLPWPGAVPGTSAGAVGGVNIVPGGSLTGISYIPVDGTIVTTVDSMGKDQNSYVVWGGAKFLIPLDVLNDLNLSAQLGILGKPPNCIPIADIDRIPDVPRDGTVLKEISGPDPYLIQFGMKKRVVGPRRFFDLGLFWPAVGTLWDHALDGFPDAGLA
jgi:predicted acylesterase/phospholipase RssA